MQIKVGICEYREGSSLSAYERVVTIAVFEHARTEEAPFPTRFDRIFSSGRYDGRAVWVAHEVSMYGGQRRDEPVVVLKVALFHVSKAAESDACCASCMSKVQTGFQNPEALLTYGVSA